MMKLSNEQIDQILDGAPSDARRLSDLREIISLRQHVQVLKRYKDLAEACLDIYNCKKCNGLVNRGFICHSCGYTDPTHPKDKADEWF